MVMKNSLSGYPEWLPEDRMVEQSIIDTIRAKFELHGFAPVETRSVEALEVILAKGETDKEIYILRRLQAPEEEADKSIGLHFDLTVPFARYVVENRNDLSFPFRRYQIQKAWRGERPGLGRYREFLQADVDIVDTRPLSIHSDIEIVALMAEILDSLPLPRTQFRVNNRKLLEGFYVALGIKNTASVLRVVDKLDKIGEEKVMASLVDDLKLPLKAAEGCVGLGTIRESTPEQLHHAVSARGIRHPLIEEGLSELFTLLQQVPSTTNTSIVADLSVARGFDYYTGTVCEVKFVDLPKYPTIAAGGRYDSLVSDGKNSLPGMGMSIGITRMLGVVLHEGVLRISRKVPSAVMIAMASDEGRTTANGIAEKLRKRGIACEVFPHPLKYGKQIAYADKNGIPFVWFPVEDGARDGEVLDMRSKIQIPANSDSWMPAHSDLIPQVVLDQDAMASLYRNRTYAR